MNASPVPANDALDGPRAASSRRGMVLVVAMLFGVPVSLTALVLSHATARSEVTVGAEATPVGHHSTTSKSMAIELGRVICGDCCVSKLWNAIGRMPGVQDINAKAGQHKVVVYYDDAKTGADQVLSTLVASGEGKAKLSSVDANDAEGGERHWIRPVRRVP